MSAGQVQVEGVLHPCWMHLGGSQPLPANPRPVLTGCDERVSLRCPATGIDKFTAVSNWNSATLCIFLNRTFKYVEESWMQAVWMVRVEGWSRCIVRFWCFQRAVFWTLKIKSCSIADLQKWSNSFQEYVNNRNQYFISMFDVYQLCRLQKTSSMLCCGHFKHKSTGSPFASFGQEPLQTVCLFLSTGVQATYLYRGRGSLQECSGPAGASEPILGGQRWEWCRKGKLTE